MESATGSEQSLLVLELTGVEELLKQLEADLDQPSGMGSCKSLASKILSSIQKAICMAKSSDLEGNRQAASPYAGTDSSGSPRSENSEMSKKRKTQPKWTSQVRVGTGEGIEGDGHNWRKYGQKDILGAKYPRAYYRCTHRKTRGCPAIKQVQRSDGNPLLFDVTYRGTHTCHQTPQLVWSRERDQKQNLDHVQTQQQQDLLLSFRTGLRVKTDGSGSEGQDLASPSFSFPCTPVGCLKLENPGLSSPSTPENCFMDCFSPTFISPATSESNYFSVSPCRMSTYGGGPNLQTPESDFTEIISAANSPLGDIDFLLNPVEFERDFPFDTSSFFSQDLVDTIQ